MGRLDDMRKAIAKSKGVPPPPKRPKTPRQRDTVLTQKTRLPGGSAFAVTYDSATQTWSGTLTVPGVGALTASHSGVFTLLSNLDDQYRVTVNSNSEVSCAERPVPKNPDGG